MQFSAVGRLGARVGAEPLSNVPGAPPHALDIAGNSEPSRMENGTSVTASATRTSSEDVVEEPRQTDDDVTAWPLVEPNPDVPDVPDVPDEAVVVVEHPDGSADVGIDCTKLPKAPVPRRQGRNTQLLAARMETEMSTAFHALRLQQAEHYRRNTLRKRRIVFMVLIGLDTGFFLGALLYLLLTGGLSKMRRKGLVVGFNQPVHWWINPTEMTLEEISLSLLVDLVGIVSGAQDKTFLIGFFMVVQTIATVLLSLRGFSLLQLYRVAELVVAGLLRAAIFNYLRMTLSGRELAQLENMFIGVCTYLGTMTGFCGVLCGRDEATLRPTADQAAIEGPSESAAVTAAGMATAAATAAATASRGAGTRETSAVVGATPTPPTARGSGTAVVRDAAAVPSVLSTAPDGLAVARVVAVASTADSERQPLGQMPLTYNGGNFLAAPPSQSPSPAQQQQQPQQQQPQQPQQQQPMDWAGGGATVPTAAAPAAPGSPGIAGRTAGSSWALGFNWLHSRQSSGLRGTSGGFSASNAAGGAEDALNPEPPPAAALEPPPQLSMEQLRRLRQQLQLTAIQRRLRVYELQRHLQAQQQEQQQQQQRQAASTPPERGSRESRSSWRASRSGRAAASDGCTGVAAAAGMRPQHDPWVTGRDSGTRVPETALRSVITGPGPGAAGAASLASAGSVGTNGHVNGHLNGYANGHVNGHLNGYANGFPPGSYSPPACPESASVTPAVTAAVGAIPAASVHASLQVITPASASASHAAAGPVGDGGLVAQVSGGVAGPLSSDGMPPGSGLAPMGGSYVLSTIPQHGPGLEASLVMQPTYSIAVFGGGLQGTGAGAPAAATGIPVTAATGTSAFAAAAAAGAGALGQAYGDGGKLKQNQRVRPARPKRSGAWWGMDLLSMLRRRINPSYDAPRRPSAPSAKQYAAPVTAVTATELFQLAAVPYALDAVHVDPASPRQTAFLQQDAPTPDMTPAPAAPEPQPAWGVTSVASPAATAIATEATAAAVAAPPNGFPFLALQDNPVYDADADPLRCSPSAGRPLIAPVPGAPSNPESATRWGFGGIPAPAVAAAEAPAASWEGSGAQAVGAVAGGPAGCCESLAATTASETAPSASAEPARGRSLQRTVHTQPDAVPVPSPSLTSGEPAYADAATQRGNPGGSQRRLQLEQQRQQLALLQQQVRQLQQAQERRSAVTASSRPSDGPSGAALAGAMATAAGPRAVGEAATAEGALGAGVDSRNPGLAVGRPADRTSPLAPAMRAALAETQRLQRLAQERGRGAKPVRPPEPQAPSLPLLYSCPAGLGAGKGTPGTALVATSLSCPEAREPVVPSEEPEKGVLAAARAAARPFSLSSKSKSPTRPAEPAAVGGLQREKAPASELTQRPRSPQPAQPTERTVQAPPTLRPGDSDTSGGASGPQQDSPQPSQQQGAPEKKPSPIPASRGAAEPSGTWCEALVVQGGRPSRQGRGVGSENPPEAPAARPRAPAECGPAEPTPDITLPPALALLQEQLDDWRKTLQNAGGALPGPQPGELDDARSNAAGASGPSSPGPEALDPAGTHGEAAGPPQPTDRRGVTPLLLSSHPLAWRSSEGGWDDVSADDSATPRPPQAVPPPVQNSKAPEPASARVPAGVVAVKRGGVGLATASKAANTPSHPGSKPVAPTERPQGENASGVAATQVAVNAGHRAHRRREAQGIPSQHLGSPTSGTAEDFLRQGQQHLMFLYQQQLLQLQAAVERSGGGDGRVASPTAGGEGPDHGWSAGHVG